MHNHHFPLFFCSFFVQFHNNPTGFLVICLLLSFLLICFVYLWLQQLVTDFTVLVFLKKKAMLPKETIVFPLFVFGNSSLFQKGPFIPQKKAGTLSFSGFLLLCDKMK